MEVAPEGEVLEPEQDDPGQVDSNFAEDDMLVVLETDMLEEPGWGFSVISPDKRSEDTDSAKDTGFDLSKWIACVDDEEKSDNFPGLDGDVDLLGWEGAAGLLDAGGEGICLGAGEGPFRIGHEPVVLTDEDGDPESFSIFPKRFRNIQKHVSGRYMKIQSVKRFYEIMK